MIQKEKTNKDLGKEIHKLLVERGIETPIIQNTLNKDVRRINIQNHFEQIMNNLGLDLNDDSLKDSSERVAKMFVNEIFYGLDYDNFPKCTAVENKMKYSSMIIERDINSISTCEHHFVVIDGVCHVGYIPHKKILGLSKINRVVEFFSKRPQIQERLTEQVYCALSYILETEDVAVVVDSKHFCVKTRGIRDVNSSTITSKMGGVFFDEESCRKEFLTLIKLSK